MKKIVYILSIIIIILTSCEKEHELYDSPVIEKDVVEKLDYSNDFISFKFNGIDYQYQRFNGIVSDDNGFLVWELSRNDFYIEREIASPDGVFNLNITFPADSFGISYAYNYMKYPIYNYKQTETKDDNNNNGKFGTCFQIKDENNIVYRSLQTDDIDNFYNKITSIELVKIYNNEAFFSVKGEFAVKLKSVNTNKVLEGEIHNGEFAVIVSTRIK